jgi:hypothetical protein
MECVQTIPWRFAYEYPNLYPQVGDVLVLRSTAIEKNEGIVRRRLPKDGLYPPFILGNEPSKGVVVHEIFGETSHSFRSAAVAPVDYPDARFNVRLDKFHEVESIWRAEE